MPISLDSGDVAVFLISLVVVLLCGRKVIQWLTALKFGQNINTDAPDGHKKKQGTPTMGGVLMVLGVSVALIICSVLPATRGWVSEPLIVVYLVFVGHAALGFLDDYLNIKRGKSLGLRAREKLVGQLAITILFAVWLFSRSEYGFTTVIQVWPGVNWDLGFAYYAFVVLGIMLFSNAANFTDGLDGLAGSQTILVSVGLGLTVFTTHLGLTHLPLFAFALAGSCLGFLWFNAHPASVFMGDTGSLAIGAGLSAMAFVGKQEVLLFVFSAVFLAEILSVMIQVSVFKATGGKGKGRRVFLMTPIHHHFELVGWDETQIVSRFGVVGVIFLAIGMLIYLAYFNAR